ncbi:MAG: nucleoside 2-deoxyribosyltransferase domain-containing protein [Patescibacteria group bacterium]
MSEKKKIKVYLAGAFVPYMTYLDWRNYVKERLDHDIDFYDPRKDTNQTSIAHFVYEDLERGVVESDLVFYFVTGVGDVGAAAECAFGIAKGKFVVLCVNDGVRMVHPFVLGMGKRVFIGLDAGMAYLKNLAKYGLKDEYTATYDTMKELG